jgi:hypothetical protein
MTLHCPHCSRSYENEVQCPRCAVRLVPEPFKDDPDDPLPPHWSRNPWGRTILGVLLAQGLFFAIHEILIASRIAVGDESAGLWTHLSGVLTVQGLQLAALMAGSLLAGAGQRNGGLYGSFVGVWNGILSVLVSSMQGELVTAVDYYSQPLLHTAIGGLGGLVGAWIWKAPGVYMGMALRDRPKVSAEFLAGVLAGQVSWFRVTVGMLLAVGGYLWADTVLAFVISKSEHHMTVRSALQQQLMTMEIMGLALFFGGAIGGTSTWNGTVQGLWTGMLTSAVLIGRQVGYLNSWDFQSIVITTGTVIILCTIGGTFGAKLLPPVVRNYSKTHRPAPV